MFTLDMLQLKKVILLENLSYNAKSSLKKGIFIGSITIIIYLLVVILTTPNLSPVNATFAALKTNSIIIIGLGIGIGLQFYISGYNKSLGCEINRSRNEDSKEGRRFLGFKKGKSILRRSSDRNTTGSATAALSSFFSFFSLVPLGCCGSWLLVLSMLPSIFGTTTSIILIEYSKMLSYLSLVIVFGFALLSAYKLRKRLKKIDESGQNKDNNEMSYSGHT